MTNEDTNEISRLVREMLACQSAHEERLSDLENHRKRQEIQLQKISDKMDRLISLAMASLFTFVGGLIILVLQNVGGGG